MPKATTDPNAVAVHALIEMAEDGREQREEDMYYDKAAYDDGDRATFARKKALCSVGARLAGAVPALLAACDDSDLDEAHDNASELFEDPEADTEILRNALVVLFDRLCDHAERRRTALARVRGE